MTYSKNIFAVGLLLTLFLTSACNKLGGWKGSVAENQVHTLDKLSGYQLLEESGGGYFGFHNMTYGSNSMPEHYKGNLDGGRISYDFSFSQEESQQLFEYIEQAELIKEVTPCEDKGLLMDAASYYAKITGPNGIEEYRFDGEKQCGVEIRLDFGENKEKYSTLFHSILDAHKVQPAIQ